MHSSRIRTACSSSRHGGGLNTPLGADPPWEQTPLLEQALSRCGPGDLPRCGPGDPSWVWAWKPARHAGIPLPPRDLLQGMLGYHLKCMLGYQTPHPHEQNHRHIEKHNLAPTSLLVVNRLSVLLPAKRREKIYKK